MTYEVETLKTAKQLKRLIVRNGGAAAIWPLYSWKTNRINGWRVEIPYASVEVLGAIENAGIL